MKRINIYRITGPTYVEIDGHRAEISLGFEWDSDEVLTPQPGQHFELIQTLEVPDEYVLGDALEEPR